MIKTESWCGHKIRFIEKDGEWWAILKDICDALYLRTAKVAERLDPEMLIRVPVPVEVPSKDVDSQTYWMLAMTYPEIQEDINHILATLYWDEETGKLMQSITVQGGDVDQVPFE